MKKFLSTVLMAATVAALSVVAFAAPSPTSKDAEAEALNVVSTVSTSEANASVTAGNATAADLTAIQSAITSSSDKKIIALIELTATKDGAAYTGEMDVTIDASAFLTEGDTLANFEAYTVKDGVAEKITVNSIDTTAKTMSVHMTHFSPLGIVRVANPATGDVNVVPYIVAISACVVALGAVLVLGKKKRA